MKRLFKYFCLSISILSFLNLTSVFAQENLTSSYKFEDNLLDEYGNFVPFATDSIQFIDADSGKALFLSGENYINLPIELSEAIQLNRSFQIEMDFMITGSTDLGSERNLVGNKDRNYDTPGFHVRLADVLEPGKEGQFQADFNIGQGLEEISETVFDLKMNTWHTLSLTFDFEAGEFTYRVNGLSFNQSLYTRIDGASYDPTKFLETINTEEIFIGAFAPGHFETEPNFTCFGGGYCDQPSDLVVDNLRIYSPKLGGDSRIVNSALDYFSDELEGVTSHNDSETEETLVNDLRGNLYGSNLDSTIHSIRRFVEAFDTYHDPVFEGYLDYVIEQSQTDGFDAMTFAYFDLGVWLMREGYTTENMSQLEGLVFGIHEWFPGPVEEPAARIPSETVSIDATYLKNPGYSMMDMEVNENDELSSFVYRPTGFYAAPGELITITVDTSLVNTGMHVRVGANAIDFSSWAAINRFPYVSVDYRIEQTSFQVANPFGGGIYILVPQNTELGWVDVEIDGAVRSPYFSYREGRETTQEEWEEIREYPAPFADFESDKYMFSVWSGDIRDFDQPDTVLHIWDQIMDVYATIFGRPLERMRAEAFLFDTKNGARGSFPAGYPQTPGIWSRDEDEGITQGVFSPFSVLIDTVWALGQGWDAMFHEMGHTHLPPTIERETETIVNVPAAALLTEVFGLDYDESMKWAGYQPFGRVDAAIDWILTENFRTGGEMDWDLVNMVEPDQLSYQARGYAKYVEIAALLGGWDAMGTIFKTFYDEQIESGVSYDITQPPNITREHFIRNATEALGVNINPLLHFWGIHPSEELIDELSVYPLLEGMAERVSLYLHYSPKNNAELVSFYEEKTANQSNALKAENYLPLLEDYDESYYQQIEDVILDILDTYGLELVEIVGVSNEEEETGGVPYEFDLKQNYPNPFNPSTTINYSISENAKVNITVYDLLGREVAKLVDKEQLAGNYSIRFDAQSLSSGVYIYRIQAGGFEKTRKAVLVK